MKNINSQKGGVLVWIIIIVVVIGAYMLLKGDDKATAPTTTTEETTETTQPETVTPTASADVNAEAAGTATVVDTVAQ